MFLTDEVRALLKARDTRTLTELFRDLNPYFCRYLASRGIYGERVDDIVSDCWVTFLRKIDEFEGRSSIKTYMTGILKLKTLEAQRTDRKYETPPEDHGDRQADSFTPDGWWQRDPEDPTQMMERAESKQFIVECMEGLSEAQQRAFFLKEVEGEATADICRELAITVANLGVLIHRAKDKLRKCLTGKLQLV